MDGLDGRFVEQGQADAVSSAMIADGAISAVDVDTASFSNTFWKLDGNAGTTSGTHFLGTTDAQPVEIRANNEPALRISYAVVSPNIIGGFTANHTENDSYGVVIAGGGDPGHPNVAVDNYTFIGGGRSNRVGTSEGIGEYGSYAAIAGGFGNVNEAYFGFIGGGYQNRAGGYGATIPGGAENVATGTYSLAAGFRARANHAGSFVWSDGSSAEFASSAGNQFSVRAVGGTRIVSGIDGTGIVTSGVELAAGSGSWSTLSDRGSKANFSAVDARELLTRLSRVPVQSWNYRTQDPEVRHIGPTAQDFHAAFGFGEDAQHISTVDAQGVALAAIQGLYDLMREKDAEIAALRAQVEALQQRLPAPGTP